VRPEEASTGKDQATGPFLFGVTMFEDDDLIDPASLPDIDDTWVCGWEDPWLCGWFKSKAGNDCKIVGDDDIVTVFGKPGCYAADVTLVDLEGEL